MSIQAEIECIETSEGQTYVLVSDLVNALLKVADEFEMVSPTELARNFSMLLGGRH